MQETGENNEEQNQRKRGKKSKVWEHFKDISDTLSVTDNETGNKRLYQDFSCIKIQFMKAETVGANRC